MIAWPASALLTGNGVALIMRVPGTEHGDWWSTRGWPIFASTAAVAVLSKYVTRVGNRPLLNPSNGALVVAFLIFGSDLADPQDLWWGPWSGGLALTYVVIVVGGLALMRHLRLQRVVVPFLVTYLGATAVVAASGHAMVARWHVGPITDWSWWWVVVASPELLIFLFFMITDPPTAARGNVGGAVYGAAVALVATVLMAAQGTEFATKVALLGALTLVCVFRPLIERLTPAAYGDGDRLRLVAGRVARRISSSRPRPVGAALGLLGLLAVGGLLVGAGSGQRTAAAAVGAERPDVSALVGDVPAATLDPTVAELIPGFDQAQADALVVDLATDLVIEAESIDAQDAEALPSALVGPRLDAASLAAGDTPTPTTDASGAAASDPGPIPEADLQAPTPGQRVELTSAEVAIVRTSDSPQALPSLSVIADGTADGEEFTSVFVMAKPADAYLLVDVLDPERLPDA